MGEEADRLRASDADREALASRLRAALDEGRLSLYEFDERVRDAYAAKTYGDLKALAADLPEVAPPNRSRVVPAGGTAPATPAPPAAARRGHTSRWIAGVWSSWVTVACILTMIWLLTGANGDFWPAWPLGVWGAVLIAQTVTGVARGAPQGPAWRHAERDAWRRAERDARRADRDPPD